VGKPYRIKDENGKEGNWFFFSESAGDVIDAGPDEAIALSLAASETDGATIADSLKGKEDEISSEPTLSNRTETKDGGDGLEESRGKTTDIAPSDLPKKRAALSPQFLRKIKEKAASGSATIAVELERFLIARFGFTTEDMEEDDPDVELLRLGWELQWEYWLAGKEPPAWTLILFGQICVTVRLLASAQRMQKSNPIKSIGEVEKEPDDKTTS
jgi:hypothetical protein